MAYIGFSSLIFLPIALILFSTSMSSIQRDLISTCHFFPSAETQVTRVCYRDTDILLRFLSLSLSLLLCISSHLFASGSLVMLNNTISMVNAWKENWLVLAFGYIQFFPHLKTIIDSVISKFLSFLPIFISLSKLISCLSSPSYTFFLSFSFPLVPSSPPLAFALPSFLSFSVSFFPLPWLLSWAIL